MDGDISEKWIEDTSDNTDGRLFRRRAGKTMQEDWKPGYLKGNLRKLLDSSSPEC